MNLFATYSPGSHPLQWRQFSFFEIAPVKNVHDLTSVPDMFKVRITYTYGSIIRLITPSYLLR